MARLWTSGAEQNSITANVEYTSALNGATISTTQVHSGTYAVRISSITSGANNRVSYQFKSANSTGPFFARFYMYIATLPSAKNRFFRLQDTGAGARGYLSIDNAGLLTIGDEDGDITTGDTLAIGRWYCIEYQFDASGAGGAHIIRARVNGGNLFGATNRNVGTGVAAVSYGANLAGTPEAQTVGDWYFDDMAINDNTGSFQTSWPGPGYVIILRPSAAGDVNTFASQTGGTAGAANNFTRELEVTPDDATTFNGSTTLNEEDLYNVDNSGIAASSVIGVVQVFARFRNGVAADTTCAAKLEIEKAASGTITQSAAIVPNTTTWNTNATAAPRNPLLTLYQDPDSANWKQGTIDTMQIGFKLTTGPAVATRRVDFSGVWALVDYWGSTKGFFGLM